MKTKQSASRKRNNAARKRTAILLALALMLLIGAVIAYQQGWIGRANRTADYYVPPEKPESQLFTGSGSARFSIYAPQYPGASVIEAARFEGTDGGTMMAVMTTPDDPVEVVEFYRSTLANKGFRPKVSGKGERTLVNGYRPSAGLDVMVSVARGPDDLTRIELTDNADSAVTPR